MLIGYFMVLIIVSSYIFDMIDEHINDTIKELIRG